MTRFLVCLFPALLFWWTPIVTILPLLEARPVPLTPSGHVHKDANTSTSTAESHQTDFVFGDSTTPFPEFFCEELDSFVDNITIGNSSVTPMNQTQPEAVSPALPLGVLVFISTVMAIYGIVGTVGNGLVILAFCTYRQVRTSAHSFILSISISDILMTGLQYPAGIVSMITGAPSLGEAACPLLGATLYFSTYVSFLSMLLIAFNRYVHIAKSPNTYTKLFGPGRTFLWVLSVWILSGLLVAPGFLGYGKFGWGGFRRCGLAPDIPYSVYYFSNIFGVFYWLLFIMVSGIYLGIYFSVKDSVTTMAEKNPNLVNPKQYVSKRVIKQTKHMFIIFCTYAVSTAPNVLLFSIHRHVPFLPMEMVLMIILIYFLNHVMNPFLYAWKLPVFMRAFKALIRCKRHLPFQPGAAIN